MNDQFHSYFAGKRILLSGASGYLATNLARALKNVACTLVRLSGSHPFLPIDGVAKELDIKGNIREREIWEAALVGIDIVYHFAAQTSAYVATQDPAEDLKSNVLPMVHLLEGCKKKISAR
jgi:nucleoside-diphosphate-sugar epimerase